MFNAFLVAFAYWLGQCADAYTGWQTFTRPIIFGPICGLLFGDLRTGVILGTELEAVYMGVSSIGGEAPSNYQAATCLCVGFVVLSGADMGTGLALAVTIGTLINAIRPFTEALKALLQPVFLRLAKNGEVKKFRALMFVQMLTIDQLINSIVVFIVALGGEVALEAFLNYCPAFIINGLTAASNCLVVVGLCLTTQAIWNGTTTVMFVLVGFVLSKYLGLDTLAIAIIGVVIAFTHFQSVMRTKNATERITASSATTGGDDEEGDDFFA